MLLPLNPKVTRTLAFLTAAQGPNAEMTLAGLGFDDVAVSEVWSRINRQLDLLLSAQPIATRRITAALARWERSHFRVMRSTFGWYFPEFACRRYLSKPHQTGPSVALRIDLLLARLRALGQTEGGPDALALLAVRGTDRTDIAKAEAMLAELGTHIVLPPLCPVLSRTLAEAEEDMWYQYLAWSGLARRCVGDQRVLTVLGLARPCAGYECVAV